MQTEGINPNYQISTQQEQKMREIILIKNGELVLKGLNRNTFEDILIKNMKKALAEIGEFTFKKSQSTILPIHQTTSLMCTFRVL